MAEFVRKLENLAALEHAVHWFCPRSSADDGGYYFDEDLEGGTAPERKGTAEFNREEGIRLLMIKAAWERRDDALEACKIFAFDGDDAVKYQDKLKACLKTQLSRCDVCIREYHRGRALLLASLEAEYTSEEVSAFMEKFDSMNTTRITSGLDSMAEALMDLPPEERNILSAGEAAMYALFEALNCVPFLKNEGQLNDSFDKPFRLVQTKKKVKLANYVPGMAGFLYSSNSERCTWATRNFSQVKRPLYGPEFEHDVRPFLEPAMARVNVVALELDFLPTFWTATRQVLSKLTKNLVSSNLRAMDANLFTLSLDHFQIDASHFNDLIASYQILLELSPNDFWDAIGNATPQGVIEIICQSPTLQRMLTTTEEKEELKLEEKMAWTESMLGTIKPSNIVPPLRALLDQLLNRFQGDKYSRYARSVTWERGLTCLLQAIKIVSKSVEGGPVYTHLIETVSKDYLKMILQELDGIEQKEEMQIDRTEQLDLDIIEHVLALDVKSLVRDRRILVSTREVDHEVTLSGLGTWKMSIRHIKPGHPALVASVLSGVTGLLPLEKLAPAQVKHATKQADAWNSAYARVLTYVEEDLLTRIETFNPEQLLELYQDPNAARGVIALLFNGNESIHQLALGMLKTLSAEDSRRDSLMHVVKVFLGTTLAAASNSLRLIADGLVFTPCTIALKICTDLYSCLCDSSDGVLRARGLQSENESKALYQYWQKTWTLLTTIFENTEAWSSHGHDKTRMQDFCRETMDFADFAFDQYTIIASALRDYANGKDDADIGKELLQVPNKAFRSISKWLRLRDEYLISKAVGLTEKMLGRFHSVDLQISSDSAQYLEDVVTSTDKIAKVKTKLMPYQKAELQRALERHLGEPLTDHLIADVSVPKRQSSLQNWAVPGAARSQSSTRSQNVIDVDAWTETAKQRKAHVGTLEGQYKSVLETKTSLQKEQKKGALSRSLPGAPAKVAAKSHEDQKSFLLKRQQQKAEVEKQRQAALARANAGVGSGVIGIGDIGKDHQTVKGQNVMVDSDDDEEDDDDSDLDDDLFGTKNKERKIRLPDVDPNGAIGLRPEQKKGPTRILRTARTVQNTRARLKPRLDNLHRTILNWEFFHTGDYPPNSNPDRFSQVANTFTDPTSYQNTFEALLILEAWQGMMKNREENTSKPYEIKVQNRSNVDSFIEFSSILGYAENRELQLQEGDIVLLSRARKPADDQSSPHCLGRIYRIKRQKGHLEVIYHIVPDSSLAPQLSPQTIINGLKIQSIVPLEREYGALQALQYYDLCTQIIRAKPSRRINFSERQITSFQDVWNVNQAQSEAINAAMENEGFTLIQGPPGSGKTKTIVAIVGGLLTQTLNRPNTGATRISVPGAGGNQDTAVASKKLLVCAPSNAAVDELVMRLKEGVKTKNGGHHAIKVVRIGRSDAINSQVVDVTMDELVSKRLGNSDADAKLREKNAALFKEHEQVSAQLRELFSQKDSGEVRGEEFRNLESSIASVRKRKHELSARIDNAKDQERNAGREAELNRKKAQQAVLDEAHVICATLSGSGHDMFQSLNIEFETVIIDEAAQCVEMSSLIPLKYGCIKCIMVGDPKQLPPTVFSKEAAAFQYEQSLFVRMQNNFPDEVHLLDTQYRMHPDISVFPSQTFYDGLLKDGDNMAGLRAKPWHASSLLAPYRFYDVQGQHKAAPKGHSLINVAEIEVAMALYNRLITDFADYEFNGRIGIITPYKSQLKALKEHFSRRYGDSIVETIEFNTTDAFQGRESEVIIFSCVRASPAGGIGFLQDIRRMNVGLTRAKSSLWVLGNSESLVRGKYWKKLVEDAKARDSHISGNIFSLLKKPSSAFPADTSVVRSMSDVDARVPQMNHGAREQSSSRNSSRSASDVQQENRDSPTNEEAKILSRGPSRASNGQSANGSPLIKAEAVSPTPEIGDPDRMEGVRYKAKDRIAMHKKRAAEEGLVKHEKRAAEDALDEKASKRAKVEDVEMQDADSNTATPAPSNGTRSRSGTPADRMETVNRTTKPVAPPAVRKKRPAAANPFIPKKSRAP